MQHLAGRKHATTTCMCVCMLAVLTCMPAVRGQCTGGANIPIDGAEVAEGGCSADDRCSAGNIIDLEDTSNCTKCCVITPLGDDITTCNSFCSAETSSLTGSDGIAGASESGGSGCKYFQDDDSTTAHKGVCSAVSGCGEGNFTDAAYVQGPLIDSSTCDRCCVVAKNSIGSDTKCQEFCDAVVGDDGSGGASFAVSMADMSLPAVACVGAALLWGLM